ncbi:unnamed protein product [Vitrella brassicaformis CCMP3155]|uniref:Uncharacterized protein n=2 Tax=Vitrella brassicaformis TaxID=1169539 RepID=A0A0G4EVV6_VITBC|nr:unnamed protein product [Vitrella brassicaformis CCMP3155]|eukprot:CEM02562.1 unnamed protein product [Vitrella brassicaformis CCMP3155]
MWSTNTSHTPVVALDSAPSPTFVALSDTTHKHVMSTDLPSKEKLPPDRQQVPKPPHVEGEAEQKDQEMVLAGDGCRPTPIVSADDAAAAPQAPEGKEAAPKRATDGGEEDKPKKRHKTADLPASEGDSDSLLRSRLKKLITDLQISPSIYKGIDKGDSSVAMLNQRVMEKCAELGVTANGEVRLPTPEEEKAYRKKRKQQKVYEEVMDGVSTDNILKEGEDGRRQRRPAAVKAELVNASELAKDQPKKDARDAPKSRKPPSGLSPRSGTNPSLPPMASSTSSPPHNGVRNAARSPTDRDGVRRGASGAGGDVGGVPRRQSSGLSKLIVSKKDVPVQKKFGRKATKAERMMLAKPDEDEDDYDPDAFKSLLKTE